MSIHFKSNTEVIILQSPTWKTDDFVSVFYRSKREGLVTEAWAVGGQQSKSSPEWMTTHYTCNPRAPCMTCKQYIR